MAKGWGRCGEKKRHVTISKKRDFAISRHIACLMTFRTTGMWSKSKAAWLYEVCHSKTPSPHPSVPKIVFSQSTLFSPWSIKQKKEPVHTCPWRIPNRRCQSTPPRALIFSSTMPTLSSHEKYVHGFHFPLVRDSQSVQGRRHEGLNCLKSAAEATVVTRHPFA